MERQDAEEARKQRLAELVRIFQIPQEQLQHAQAVADLYITDERPDYRRWLVTFNLLAENNQQYAERSYEVFLDSHGNLIADADYGTVLLEEKAAEARTRARQWLWMEYGLDLELCKEEYCYYEFFDCTNPRMPQWKFVFFPESFEGLSEVPVYKITLDAFSGQKINAALCEWKDIFAQAPYHEIWY